MRIVALAAIALVAAGLAAFLLLPSGPRVSEPTPPAEMTATEAGGKVARETPSEVPPEPTIAAGGEGPSPGDPSALPASGNLLDGQEVPPAARDVTPRGFTRGPEVTGPLTRVVPPAPPAPPEPEAPKEARTEKLFRPVAVSAGRLKAREAEVALAGIDAPAPEATCGDDNWPCGQMARAALRRLIRARAVDCVVPAGERKLPAATECRLGETELGEWLVRRGWARAAAERYRKAEDDARQEKLGIWSPTRPGPIGTSPEISAPAPIGPIGVTRETPQEPEPVPLPAAPTPSDPAAGTPQPNLVPGLPAQ
ncbi:thermonuclease family protein [Afifella sp. IM 167]|uniref:thermonuclease family protein n=1 Tax=Afifella sp. IM 167 TaxID=2033586 RepID=UPI001CCB6414|nr:thermonuclease family protein [Afifella sp. IM 167]MBZ8133874.1 hypothetical protein [Afifella sp. IM 167]